MRTLAFLALTLLAACQPAPSVDQLAASNAAKQRFWSSLPKTAETCTALRGEWRQAGLLGEWQCILALPDAGNKCSDASDCIGACIAASASPHLLKTSGRCQQRSDGFGCYATVGHGRASARICHD